MSDIRMPRPSIREGFRAKLRAELMNEAVALAEERRRRPFSARVAEWWTRGILRSVAVAAVLVVMLVSGAGAAAAGSLPGDVTFGLKQAAEQIELLLARSDAARAQVLAAQAQRRLEDLTRAASDRPERAPTASEAYEAAVERFRQAVQAVRDAEPADKRDAVEDLVDAAREKHVPVLETLRDRVPEPAQKGIDKALEEHKKIEQGRPSQPPGKPEQPGRSRGAAGGAASPSPSASPTQAPSLSPSPSSSASPLIHSPAATPVPTDVPRGNRPTSVPPGRP